jgi:hypothetical protein
MSSGGAAVKVQVFDKIPKRFKELKFGIQSVRLILECILFQATNLVSDPIKILSTKPSLKSLIASCSMSRRIELLSEMGHWTQEWWDSFEQIVRELMLICRQISGRLQQV